MTTETKPHLSGWCSGYDGRCTSPKAHATCQERLDKGKLIRCDCGAHTNSGTHSAPDSGTIRGESNSAPGGASTPESQGLADYQGVD